jgi:hypothetical protein
MPWAEPPQKSKSRHVSCVLVSRPFTPFRLLFPCNLVTLFFISLHTAYYRRVCLAMVAVYNYNYVAKFIVIGDMGCGKSSLLRQFTEGAFVCIAHPRTFLLLRA